MNESVKFYKNDWAVFAFGAFFIALGLFMVAVNLSTGLAFDFPKGFLISTLLSIATMSLGLILISAMTWKGERIE